MYPRFSGTLRAAFFAVAMAALAVPGTRAQQPTTFGGAYSSLEPRRQQLVENWVTRFIATTGQQLEVAPFYDEILPVSTKTTFDAVTHALMTTALTDRSGGSLGDALGLVEQVESVRGQVAGASGDRQFRIYVRLTSGAVGTLARSEQFRRGVDNSIYHKGYPASYRARGGVPSIQISVSLDGRRADIDVDYRSSVFPVSLFNGHLSSSNSDVRAGGNFNRHTNRWSGFQNWWQGFFGVRMERAPDEVVQSGPLNLPQSPRAGRKNIDEMVHDFLNAWLIEGDVVAAMGYVSEQSYACLAQDRDDPSDFDRGLAPYELMVNLRAAREALGTHSSLEGLAVGVRRTIPGLKVVTQPYHAQFVIYAVPDDIAAGFDCESRLTLADPTRVRRAYGNYFGVTFYVAGNRDTPVTLLWARENGYWKIVSWQVGVEDADTPAPEPPPDVKVVRIKADPVLVQSARGFLETWLVRKNYDAAFGYLSPKAYACYDLVRDPDQPASTSPAEAGQRIRAGLEASGNTAGKPRNLEAVISAAEPLHPAIRVMDHQYARAFSLSSMPNAIADVQQCEARARGVEVPDPLPLEYGNAFAMTVSFRTRGGEAPILRLQWEREEGAWRITSYDIEMP